MSDTTVIPEWTLADRLRKARELTGMSKEEFAGAVGISRNTVINYEKGHTSPRIIELRAWSSASRVPVEWLAPDGVRRPRQDSNLRPADYIAEPWALDAPNVIQMAAAKWMARRRSPRRQADRESTISQPIRLPVRRIVEAVNSVAA